MGIKEAQIDYSHLTDNPRGQKKNIQYTNLIEKQGEFDTFFCPNLRKKHSVYASLFLAGNEVVLARTNRHSDFLRFLAQQGVNPNTVICGQVVWEPKQNALNRIYLVDPPGKTEHERRLRTKGIIKAISPVFWADIVEIEILTLKYGYDYEMKNSRLRRVFGTSRATSLP
jgi:hypothetical protein